ncbi:UDP-glucose 4-epimerase, putative [Ichthyophthirius multifiliis]|uniref:UDP-glucose 4-epimerase n=1 Tax=Ichthyophthirius multifiliis TaxID=5932 RepID=G0QJW1_ICHMU|nr:UDP-glucose 4-epimerase, putative [Ichthyophthirius multifiliis]EGR34489.1 UDP-glucose 4-epimerase, putative [Ichthyophthirius multifiliis]|eukprot:XP_004039793.1 UDP-glucose 4-epimerase, putative [Ichthyophthirius multifiliis]
MQTILLPGGLGYIGSHVLIDLYNYIKENKKHYQICVIDNLSNCSPKTQNRIIEILHKQHPNVKKEEFFTFHEVDILDFSSLELIFQKYKISHIIHFAAKKAVGESVKNPIMYFENNVQGTLNLLKLLDKYKVKNFIFSSTAAIYGQSDDCTEDTPPNPQSPYAQSKLAVEMLMQSMSVALPGVKMIALRYFNPAGAHVSGEIGDSPSIYPSNLFPFIGQVLIGKRERLYVFGNDYNTVDGTGVRDYIHVQDLSEGHVAALKYMDEKQEEKYEIINLGTGRGLSVLEVIKLYEQACEVKIDYQITQRREGDVAKVVAKVNKALNLLGWKAKKTDLDMCKDAYNFIKKNPEGIN